MRVFIFGLTLIISAFIYLSLSTEADDNADEEFNQLPAEKKVELFSAFEKIAVKREVASKPDANQASDKSTEESDSSRNVDEVDEFEPYVEERRESIALAKSYLANHLSEHSDEERRVMEQALSELETVVEIIKVRMARSDTDRAYDLEDRFDEILSEFESMMKE